MIRTMREHRSQLLLIKTAVLALLYRLLIGNLHLLHCCLTGTFLQEFRTDVGQSMRVTAHT